MLDGKEQGWVDSDSHPSLESSAPFQRCVSRLQALMKNLPVACWALLCEEEVVGWGVLRWS